MREEEFLAMLHTIPTPEEQAPFTGYTSEELFSQLESALRDIGPTKESSSLEQGIRKSRIIFEVLLTRDKALARRALELQTRVFAEIGPVIPLEDEDPAPIMCDELPAMLQDIHQRKGKHGSTSTYHPVHD